MKKTLALVLALLFITSLSFASVQTGNGTKTVTTSGTAVAFVSTSTLVNTLEVCADIGNTGYLAVGSSPVAASGSQQGFIIAPGACVPIWSSEHASFDLAQLKVDSTVSGEKASFFWMQES